MENCFTRYSGFGQDWSASACVHGQDVKLWEPRKKILTFYFVVFMKNIMYKMKVLKPKILK